MVSKPFWLATQRNSQNDWTATQNRVNYDVFAQAPFVDCKKRLPVLTAHAHMKLYCTFEMDINPGVWASDAHCKLSTCLKHPLGEQCSLNGVYFKLVSVFSI